MTNMDNHEFDNVKTEKTNALAKYRRLRNIAKLFHVLEVFVALTLLSWSTTRLPPLFKFTANYIIQFSGYLLKLNPHVAFLIGNVIVLTVYLFSRHFDAAETNSGAASVSEEYHKCSTVDNDGAAGTCDGEIPPLVEEISQGEKQMVCFENAVAETDCDAAAKATAAIEMATRQIERFQRTQSEKLKREISMKPPRKEFRRLATDIDRKAVKEAVNDGRRRALTSFDTVDRLSNEEFRLKVEAFIEKQQSFIKSQKLAENSQ